MDSTYVGVLSMKIHVVRQGDTLLDLTQKYNVPLERILQANPEMNEESSESLSIGSKVRIPTGKISLQKHSSVDTEEPERRSIPAFKEPDSTVVEEFYQEVSPENSEQEIIHQEEEIYDAASEPVPLDSPVHSGESQNLNKADNGQDHQSWPYYGPDYSSYYPGVRQYPEPNLMPQPYYPMQHTHSSHFVPPYYQNIPVASGPVTYSSAYHPEPMGQISSIPYPGCVPCSPFPEEGAYIPVAYSDAYYPEEMGHISSFEYPGCVPCSSFSEPTPRDGYPYRKKPWKK